MPARAAAVCLCLYCLAALPLPCRTPKGDEYLKVAARSELRHDYQTAAQLCDYALQEDSHDPIYKAAAQRTRHLAGQDLLTQGRALAQDLRWKEALARFKSALLLEPDSPVARDEVHQTEEKIRSLEAAPRLELETDLIPHLKIAFNSPRISYQRLAGLAGFKVAFDASVVDSPEPTASQALAAAFQSREGEISGISVETALNTVANFTHTSWRAVTSNSIYVTHVESVARHPTLVNAPNSFNVAALNPEDALPVAARLAKLADVVHLVLQGADVNTAGSFGIKPLTLAVTANDPEIIRFLLEHHADPNAQDALRVAVSKGNPEIVSLLLSHGANVKDPNRPDRRTLLHEVCAQGSAPLIPLLVEFGADPTERDSFAETPLDLALANNNANAVTALLKLAEHNKPIERTAEDAMENATVHGRPESPNPHGAASVRPRRESESSQSVWWNRPARCRFRRKC